MRVAFILAAFLVCIVAVNAVVPVRRQLNPIVYKKLITSAIADLEAAVEDWRVYGNASNGGNWEAGFEWTSKSDSEIVKILRRDAGEKVVAALENLEAILEEWKVWGKASNGGNWEAGFEYTSKSDSDAEIWMKVIPKAIGYILTPTPAY